MENIIVMEIFSFPLSRFNLYIVLWIIVDEITNARFGSSFWRIGAKIKFAFE